MLIRMYLLAVLTITVYSSQIATLQILQTKNPQTFSLNSNLGFSDFSGSCMTSDMRTRIIQIINDASEYQGDSIVNNMKYIKQQLDIRYGSLSQEFTISIQTKDETGFFNVLISDKCSILSLKAGVNDVFPQWSYLIYKTNRTSTKFMYQDGTNKGEGITNQQLYFFVHTIMNIQPKGPCDCGSTADIWKKFYQNDKKNWNLVCSKTYSNRLYYAVDGNQYATIAFNCVYNIYVGYTSP